MRKSVTRFTLLPLVGLLALVLMACTLALGQSSGEPTVAIAEATQEEQSSEVELSSDLTDLNSIEAFQTMFSQDAGQPRLILLLSPT